jgi:hypothetical protein
MLDYAATAFILKGRLQSAPADQNEALRLESGSDAERNWAAMPI